MLDLVGNPNCWFYHAQAHMIFFAFVIQEVAASHYENFPMQYTEIFSPVKN